MAKYKSGIIKIRIGLGGGELSFNRKLRDTHLTNISNFEGRIYQAQVIQNTFIKTDLGLTMCSAVKCQI